MTTGRKIAAGREAEIYEWLDDNTEPRVLKLYRDGASRTTVERELNIAAAVNATGAPSAAAFGEVIELSGRYGFLQERIDGVDMLDQIGWKVWTAGAVGRQLGHLHAQLHDAKPEGLPTVKDLLATRVSRSGLLTELEKARCFKLLDALPDGDRIYHGDFHPGNVIVRSIDRTPIVIDWPNAAIGDPLADVARTHLLLAVGWRGDPNWRTRALGRWLTAWIDRSYLQEYCSKTGSDYSNIAKWNTVIAAARTGEGIEPEAKHLLKLVRSGLAQA